MYLEEVTLVGSSLLCMYEARENGIRYLHSFYTGNARTLYEHKFVLEGALDDEAMYFKSERIEEDEFQRLKDSLRARGLHESNALGEIIHAQFAVDLVIGRVPALVDICALTLKLDGGTTLIFEAGSQPPFVEYMSITEMEQSGRMDERR